MTIIKKTPYNKLAEETKKEIVEKYYNEKDKNFKEIANELNVSERAFARVLKEAGINTRLKNRYTLNEDYFKKIDTEEKAYWLGFIYADGYVGNDYFNNVSISSIDKDHLKKFKEAISFTGDIRKMNRSEGFETANDSFVINFSNVKMAKDLRDKGLYPGKSSSMGCLPELREDLVRHFIRGYFDGDGSIGAYQNNSIVKGKVYSYKKPSFTIISTYSFLEEIGRALPTSSYRIDDTFNHSENMGYLKVSKRSDIKNIYHYLYDESTIYLERKFNKFTNMAPLYRNV